MKILFTGGGTGGHILPIIALTREIRAQADLPAEASAKEGDTPLEFFYMGPKDEFSEMLSSQEGIKTYHIFSGKIRRYEFLKSLPKNLLDVFVKVPLGIIQAFFRIFFLGPDIIFSKGGYGSVPSTIAGWILRVPIILHESDIVPGMANKIVARFASEIFVSFPNTKEFPKNKVVEVGNPIRKDILTGSKEEAKRLFNLQGTKPVLLLLGGSQGAQRVNDMLLVILDEALKDYEIIHQTGEKNFSQVKAEAEVIVAKERRGLYHPFAFLKETELRHMYAATDLIISRAGSGSVFEIAALGKPSILIPLPESAQNHQIENAYAYQKTGACIVLEENNLTPHFFLERVHSLFANKAELQKMSEAAKNFAKPEAGRVIAKYIIESLSIS
ncbi:UDP-N-acetylglucosamine--N-acetylmuramyl-(pentapeptide) pyrophosphoryl-undecaprenol N-acetylglucosamine transferase [Patescibacteria group bacterium]|nr:UDP-N-acetylglucosamine--N-acetylmuramyl-(pentapeptide) pyrophosphoryl-undecaprenol N-acetylglucosamine transferase [Patescibacteria group bacterium]